MKTILVTGGNRGIGLEICRQLNELGHNVILGSRDIEKGFKAAGTIRQNVVVRQLDVCNEDSVKGLFDFVKNNYKCLDVLINNAGLGPNYHRDESLGVLKEAFARGTKYTGLKKIIAPVLRTAGIVPAKQNASTISLYQVKDIMETNFYGAWRMVQVFLPLLSKSGDGRIINISSGMGELGRLTGEYPGYSLSKTSLNALTIMFSNELQGRGIKVNAMCPGWVRTDMGGPNAPRDASQGADTAVWLAIEKDIPTGRFFRDRNEIIW